MNMLMILSVLQVLSLTDAYEFTCPSKAHWRLRAESRCLHKSIYSCLYDVNLQVNVYRDKCMKPRILGPGYKYVFQPNPNRASCSLSRYQPFIFNTTGYSDCVYIKSLCNSEGQIVYENGTTRSDRRCTCNEDIGYNFVRKPNHRCYCNPSYEDCSCYSRLNSNNNNFGLKDLKCSGELNVYQNSHSQENKLDKSQAHINEFDNYKYNLKGPTTEHRTSAVIFVFILAFLYLLVVVSIYFIQRSRMIKLQEDRKEAKKLVTDSVKEERYFVKVMIVGKENVGKTCLLKRLLKEDFAEVPTCSTDGIDIVAGRCKINTENGKWIIDKKDASDDKQDRIQRAKLRNKNTDIKAKSVNLDSKDAASHKSKDTERNEPVNTIQHNNDISEVRPKNQTAKLDPSTFTSNTEYAKERHKQIGNIDNSIENESIPINHQTIAPVIDDNKIEMPPDLMSHVVSSPFTSDIPSSYNALCGLWDFAGQKEFYATHQAFLTSHAIYLVVADFNEDICTQGVKQYFEDFQHSGDFVDFWFDTIHCYQTINSKEKEEKLYPRIIMVFTGKDKYKKADIESREEHLRRQIQTSFGHLDNFKHLQKIFFVSNKIDPDEKFEAIRREISETAKKMGNWGEELPLKWILLERLVEINKEKGKNFINRSDLVEMAAHPDIKIKDPEMLCFLRFQHEVGNIISFEDIPDLIVLNPQWLVNAFRCLVSDTTDKTVQYHPNYAHFARHSIITECLIKELFRSKGQFSEKTNELIKIMEKFDILVKIDEHNEYIMPSMMPASSFDKVCHTIGVGHDNCKRSSWFCLKFSFLPPAFFNHFSVEFLKKYKPTRLDKVSKGESILALFRGICVFDYDQSGCEKLLLTMSADRIAIQLLSFSKTPQKDIRFICSEIRQYLIDKTETIKKRYKLTLSYDLHFKCNTGNFYEDSKSYGDLTNSPIYHCNQHKEEHKSEDILLPWMMNENESKKILHEQANMDIGQDEPIREWPPNVTEQQEMEKHRVNRIQDIHSPQMNEYNQKSVYRLHSEKRGKVLMINNTFQKRRAMHRQGSEIDLKNLTNLFEQLHFEVVAKTDLTAQEMMSFLEKERNGIKKLINIDCLVLILMTHGDSGYIYGNDRKLIKLTDITRMFETDSCPCLDEKPRLVFVQACRLAREPVLDELYLKLEKEKNLTEYGDQLDPAPFKYDEKPTLAKHPSADFLVVYASPEGSFSYRSIATGSWFLNAVVWIFKYHANHDELQHLLIRVNNLVANGRDEHSFGPKLALLEVKSSLRKKFYFFPGVYGDPPPGMGSWAFKIKTCTCFTSTLCMLTAEKSQDIREAYYDTEKKIDSVLEFNSPIMYNVR